MLINVYNLLFGQDISSEIFLNNTKHKEHNHEIF